MSKPLTLATTLLITTALVPMSAHAQIAGDGAQTGTTAGAEGGAVDATATPDTVPGAATGEAEIAAEPDVSAPGGGIVVVGRRDRNVVRSSPTVVSVLSTEDIKRTGEGNIAGSLQRVTGLSVVGGGFVYVRGLGDRYSSALLNGSPLPSPEPLKRVVPLDLFPTNVIASTLVQKSFSANYPGEFGGGVINLTTTAIPEDSFLQIGLGGSWNTETTNQLGYTYQGGGYDWSGFDNGGRTPSPALRAAMATNDATLFNSDAARLGLVDTRYSVVQRNENIPMNFSGSLTGAMVGELGAADIGMVFSAGYSNKWRTRNSLQQSLPGGGDLASKQRVVTDNQVTLNGILALSAKIDDQQLRWTTLFIHDTIKRGALSLGTDEAASFESQIVQDTAWYERQLINTQLSGDFKFDDLSISLRGAYANSQREAPYESKFTYYRPQGGTDYINTLVSGEGADAQINFGDLNEDLWSAGADATYSFSSDFKVTGGYAFSDAKRHTAQSNLFIRRTNAPVGLEPLYALRPDFLLATVLRLPSSNFAVLNLVEGGLTDFDAGLRVHGAYGLVNAQVLPNVSINAGVRYEHGYQQVNGYASPSAPLLPANRRALVNEYWLPAATLTWEVRPDMQLRLSGSKTLARPQFRELIAQRYLDTEADRIYRGNNNLIDSELWNADIRYEWYFDRDQKVTLAAFYKSIDKPIETYSENGEDVRSFVNAPKATLYGAEVEVLKYFPLERFGGAFFESRRLAVSANYTYTQSELKIGASDTVVNYAGGLVPATNVLVNGDPMTGQSDHIANFQIGVEDTDGLSQQTILVNYASKRLTGRAGVDPNIFEYPGITIDFVARQGITLGGVEAEAKFEVRNITGRKYEEYQLFGDRRIYSNRYDIGTTFSGSVSFRF